MKIRNISPVPYSFPMYTDSKGNALVIEAGEIVDINDDIAKAISNSYRRAFRIVQNKAPKVVEVIESIPTIPPMTKPPAQTDSSEPTDSKKTK